MCLRDPGDRAPLGQPVTRAEIPRLGGSGDTRHGGRRCWSCPRRRVTRERTVGASAPWGRPADAVPRRGRSHAEHASEAGAPAGGGRAWGGSRPWGGGVRRLGRGGGASGPSGRAELERGAGRQVSGASGQGARSTGWVGRGRPVDSCVSEVRVRDAGLTSASSWGRTRPPWGRVARAA